MLINNASVMADERRRNDAGVERTFATNVLGTFALTQALIPALTAGAPSRVITVSSGGMYGQRLDLDAMQGETGESSTA